MRINKSFKGNNSFDLRRLNLIPHVSVCHTPRVQIKVGDHGFYLGHPVFVISVGPLQVIGRDDKVHEIQYHQFRDR